MDEIMSEQVGITMHMTVKWKEQVAFIFKSWECNGGAALAIGLIFTFLIGMLTIAIPHFKLLLTNKLFANGRGRGRMRDQRNENENENEGNEPSAQHSPLWFTFVYIMVYSLIQIASMMLLMTFNGYVIICLASGISVAYAIWTAQSEDKSVPVNCCC